MNDMGKLLDCKPKLVHFSDFVLTKKLIFGSHIPAIYRLKEDKSSMKVIKSLPRIIFRSFCIKCYGYDLTSSLLTTKVITAEIKW